MRLKYLKADSCFSYASLRDTEKNVLEDRAYRWQSNETRNLAVLKKVMLVKKVSGCVFQTVRESGVHRVQRVPETESGGRVAATAASVGRGNARSR